MKISKKDLRKIILESMIKEADEPEEVSQSFLDKIASFPADALKQVSSAVSSAMSTESDKPDDAATSGEESEEAPAEKTGSKKIKRNKKTEYIQNRLQMAGAYSTKSGNDDGQWGKGTTAAWKNWLTLPVTLEKFAALVKEKNAKSSTTNESRELFDLFSKIISEADDDAAEKPKDSGIPDELQKLFDKGAAAPIAAYFGLKPNLTGVEQLVKRLEDVEVPEEEEAAADQEDDGEEAVEVAETAGGDENLELSGGLKIKYERFRQDKSGNPIKPAREGRTVDVQLGSDQAKLPEPISEDEGKKLKTFRRMFFIREGDTGYILIKKAGKNYKLSPFKLEGNLVVEDRAEEQASVQESLSRGSLIRKRYWGRY